MASYRIVYLCADLRRVGPTNQTLNIVKNANEKLDDVLVLTLFEEPKNSIKNLFEQRNILCKSLSLKRNSFILGFLRLFYFLKQNEVKLIHSYGVKPDILLFFVSKFFKIPYVLTQRCIPIEDYPFRMNKMVGCLIAQIHTFVLNHSKNVVACSKYLCCEMKRRYNFKKISYIQNGIDLEQYKNNDKLEARKILKINPKLVVFISTGLFLERKHNDEIIDAYIRMKNDNSILIMLGDGPLFEETRQKYISCKNVIFGGLCSNVPDYLAASDYFVSASDSEGLPNAVLEALACGCPVILSDIPQHREILDEMPNCGRVFPLHNVNTLSTTMQKCCSEKTEFDDTVTIIKKSPFTMREMGAKYKEYYKEILC